MAHTNSTTNLSLPQFIGTDKPTWLGDINGAFSAIDSYAGTNDAAVAAVDAKADNAVADASSAVTTATAANNTAGTASTTATAANNLATQALTTANNADGHTNQLETKVGLLADLHTTNKTSIVNAINEVADAEGDLSSLTTTDKTSLVAAINEVAQGGGSGSGADVLYTNPDSTQQMAAGTVATVSDCPEYAYFIIECRMGAGGSVYESQPAFNGNDTRFHYTGATGGLVYRLVTVSQSGSTVTITVGNGTEDASGGGSSTNNGYYIVNKVLGIK